MNENYENLDAFVDSLDPVAEILSDEKLAAAVRKGAKPIEIAKVAIRNHKDAVIELLAIMEGESPEDYVVGNPFVLFGKLIKFLNTPEIQELFTSQGQKTAAAFSGSAMENTKEKE